MARVFFYHEFFIVVSVFYRLHSRFFQFNFYRLQVLGPLVQQTVAIRINTSLTQLKARFGRNTLN